MKFESTRYGFQWGPAEVTRIHSDDQFGVVMEIKSGRGSIQVRVTPTGLIRVTDARGVRMKSISEGLDAQRQAAE